MRLKLNFMAQITYYFKLIPNSMVWTFYWRVPVTTLNFKRQTSCPYLIKVLVNTNQPVQSRCGSSFLLRFLWTTSSSKMTLALCEYNTRNSSSSAMHMNAKCSSIWIVDYNSGSKLKHLQKPRSDIKLKIEVGWLLVKVIFTICLQIQQSNDITIC